MESMAWQESGVRGTPWSPWTPGLLHVPGLLGNKGSI